MAENKWLTAVITLLIGVLTLCISGWGPSCSCLNHQNVYVFVGGVVQ